MLSSLRIVDSTQPEVVLRALHRALDATGPAVLPRAPRSLGDREAHGSDTARDEEFWDVNKNIALVVETSGSTGTPKRVALDREALRSSATASALALCGRGQWLLAVPAHYIAGASVLVRSIEAGTKPVVYPDGHFDAEQFSVLAATMTHENRYTSLVPVQLARIISAIEGGSEQVAVAARRFDGILVGGQALATDLAERARTLGMRIHTTYGSSETSGGCVYDGTPFDNTVVRLNDGMLEISGPTLARGYLGDPVRTRSSFVESEGRRWYRTGDLGEIIEGIVRVHGRADNVIISGGEKVLLDAVERVVREVTGCSEAIVIAEDHSEWGQVPVAVVPTVSATRIGDLSSIRSRVVEQLGRAAAPARIEFVAEIPLLATGKPDRLGTARLVTHQRERHAGPHETALLK